MAAQPKLVSDDKTTAWIHTFDWARDMLWPVVSLRVLVGALYVAMFVVSIVAVSYTYAMLKGAFIEFMQTNLFSKIGSMR